MNCLVKNKPFNHTSLWYDNDATSTGISLANNITEKLKNIANVERIQD